MGGATVIVYLNGAFLPSEAAMISPLDRGFLLGDGVYEVIRWDTGKFYRMDSHMERFVRSLSLLKIDFPDVLHFPKIAQNLIKKNDLAGSHAKVYFQVTRGAAPRVHSFPEPDVVPTVYGFAQKFVPRDPNVGISVITMSDPRWARCDIKAITLLPNVLARQDAIDAGADEALFVRDGVVTECTSSSFFAVFDGTVFTAPDSNYILPGITRDSVIRLCGQLSIPIKLFPVAEGDLSVADELFIAGTTAEVTPIVSLNGRPVVDGRCGVVTKRLQRALTEDMA